MNPLHALFLSAALCAACASTSNPPPSPRSKPSTAPAATPAAAPAPQEESPAAASMPEPTPPLEAHLWLGQLVGEWDFEGVADRGPDLPPERMQCIESVRKLGELWVVAEMKNGAFSSMMTLGYDPKRACYVGTWVDNIVPVLWQYTGRLEQDGRALVLEAEGPNMTDPERTAKYRDTILIQSPDHRHLTAAVQNDDGTWTDFMTADYKRRK